MCAIADFWTPHIGSRLTFLIAAVSLASLMLVRPLTLRKIVMKRRSIRSESRTVIDVIPLAGCTILFPFVFDTFIHEFGSVDAQLLFPRNFTGSVKRVLLLFPLITPGRLSKG